jgi:glycosyltransferase involved in cell wall biosynthesis
LIFRVEHIEGRGILQKIRDYLIYDKIYIAEFMRKNRDYSIIRNSFLPFECKKQKHTTFNIYIIGSICKNKNQLFGLEVFREISKKYNYKLILVGNILEKDYYQTLQNYIQKYNLNVEIKGFMPKEEIYSDADIVFITSTFETFGLTFIEALYCQIPVIAPKIAAFLEISDIIGYNSTLYTNKEECVLLFEQRDQISLDIKKRVINSFSIQKMEYDFYNYMEDIIER